MLISSYRDPDKNACLNSSDRLRGVRRPGDFRGTVLIGLGYRRPALQLLPLFALHSKARRKSAIAKDGEFDCGECDSGIYACGLEFLLVERDVVDHLERQHQQACYERYDECGRCDLGVRAVPLDAFLFLFGELLHGGLDPHRSPPVIHACP